MAEGSRAGQLINRLPRAPIVSRVSALRQLVRDRRVVHIGFVDAGRMTLKRQGGEWLHEQLSMSARELIGIDVDEEGVQLATNLGFEAYLADCQDDKSLESLCLEPADLVLGGELIEHLDQPGAFLEAVKCLLKSEGMLVLTTPNATWLENFAAAILRREVVNPDHVCWYSWRTLVTLLSRHGWELQQFNYYASPRLTPAADFTRGDRALANVANAFRILTRPIVALWPSLAEGMVAVAVQTQPTPARRVKPSA